LIYRLDTISAADSCGARRNRARRRRGDAVASESTREKTTRASEGVRPVRLTEPPGRVRPGRLAPTGGPGPIGGPRLAERERECEVLIRKIKIEIELKKGFFRKTFQHPIKSRKINLIFAKITLNDLWPFKSHK
jgi:hypothetical protein